MKSAQNMSLEAVKGKLATMTGKDETVVKKMAATFKALCKEADFTAPDKQPETSPHPETPRLRRLKWSWNHPRSIRSQRGCRD